ncbi:MAG TPA: hypothetical protein VD968_08590 [Pyrinomonadaceae bacterium]|nr:hypothetical protein [Pyrinomonadaceae bacterium]
MLESIREGVIPGARNFERAEGGFPLGSVGPAARAVDVRNALVNSIGFDGHCCALVISRPGLR